MGFRDISVTMHFNADIFRQASGQLLTAFPLSREGYRLTKPLPGLTATIAIYCSVLHFNVTTAWNIRGKPRFLVDREPVEISSIEF